VLVVEYIVVNVTKILGYVQNVDKDLCLLIKLVSNVLNKFVHVPQF